MFWYCGTEIPSTSCSRVVVTVKFVYRNLDQRRVDIGQLYKWISSHNVINCRLEMNLNTRSETTKRVRRVDERQNLIRLE